MVRLPRIRLCAFLALLGSVPVAGSQSALDRENAQERKQAEHDVPLLVDVLELKPGMTVADVGAGSGGMSIVLAKWLGPSGRVYATDIAAAQLKMIREGVDREKLTNVTVVEGAAEATNLPAGCCDVILMQDVYHHIGPTAAFNKSLLASLKPGGRLVVIDFLPRPGSPLPEGVNANRGGHGIPPAILIGEVVADGFNHVRTIDRWPPDARPQSQLFLCLFRRP